MPAAVAAAYDKLGESLLDFSRVFRPDNGNCLRSMGLTLRELAALAASGQLCSDRGLELLHSACSAGHIALERVISWHRQPPERSDWLPYFVSIEEAEALSKINRSLRNLDREVQDAHWKGLGGGVHFTQAICSLEAICQPEVDLAGFNAGMGNLVLQFALLALYRS